MKNKRSALSILIVMCLIITSFVPSLVFAEGESKPSDILKLQQLGIVDNSVADTDSIFTREQLLKAIIAAKALSDEAAALEGSTIFPDIASGSELSGYVNTVLSRGIMYGMPDGYFHPERGVTYSEACVTLVKLLGYTDSDVTGIWPNNYISKATDLKLNEGIRLRKNDKLTIGAAAAMLNRLLDTKVKKANNTAADMTFSEAIKLYTEIVVYDTSVTYGSLASNAILTNKGTLYLSDTGMKLQAGSSYRVSLEGNSIEKVFGKVGDSLGITVDSFIDNTVYYKEKELLKSRILPSDVTYYYHGVKQIYEKLKDILKTNTSIVFTNNDGSTEGKYAVIIDPIYSKPEIAEKFDAASDRLGDIVFDLTTKLVKKGKEVLKTDIEELDVVYSVTDVMGNNRIIYIYGDKAEGDIKGFSTNGQVPTNIKIDNSTYNFSKDINQLEVLKLKEGDKVAALLGYDGKVVAVRKIDYKIGNEIEVKILGSNKTSDNLSSNQVLTEDNKKYYVLEGVNTLEVGGEYKVNIDGDTIVKVKERLNALYNYSIRRVSENTIYYGGGQNPDSTILPQISTYYYHGAKIDYKTVLDSLKLGSSVVFSVKNGIYDYGVVVDPVYSKPIIMSYETKETIDRISDSSLFIYKGGEYYNLTGFIENGDVVYSVSDLWDINKYIYVADTQIRGKIKNITPNKISPKSIQLDNTTYSISKYFDVSKLNKAKVDSYVKITLDIDGKVIDLNIY